jgi:hypothetical protein
MTGSEFQIIRRFNRIRQEDIINEIPRFKSRATMYLIEKEKLVPPRFVMILSKLTGVNFLDPEIAKSFYNQIPNKFKKIMTRRKKEDIPKSNDVN